MTSTPTSRFEDERFTRDDESQRQAPEKLGGAYGEISQAADKKGVQLFDSYLHAHHIISKSAIDLSNQFIERANDTYQQAVSNLGESATEGATLNSDEIRQQSEELIDGMDLDERQRSLLSAGVDCIHNQEPELAGGTKQHPYTDLLTANNAPALLMAELDHEETFSCSKNLLHQYSDIDNVISDYRDIQAHHLLSGNAADAMTVDLLSIKQHADCVIGSSEYYDSGIEQLLDYSEGMGVVSQEQRQAIDDSLSKQLEFDDEASLDSEHELDWP
ncbi:hypothetical protein [Ferrimonas aestuarii]|uniref:Uncharacterized protein n=1 Tax=Ferrimonas aestuarii TaxID=2569539 RepID=A0A4U1BVR1_9GAMM|nr:hypothetical protein [Ferrimonas aestuarii]TKB58554.1 hypothetical protein FCL42_02060 [Ferrimonas aestuarii]